MTRLIRYTCMRLFLFATFIIFSGMGATAQVLTGTVWRSDTTIRLSQTLVINKTSGDGVISANDGSFQLSAHAGDRIIFAHTGYENDTLIVNEQNLKNPQVIKLVVRLVQLREFRITAYKPKVIDPIERRKEYSYILDRPTPSIMNPISLIYDQFSKKGREMRKFEEYFYKYEQERAINSRFTPELVEHITGLKGDELNDFMKISRPSYSFSQIASDYDFIRYVQIAYSNYISVKHPDWLPPTPPPPPPPLGNPDLKDLPVDTIKPR